MSLASAAAGVLRIVRRSLRQHALSTAITALSVALAAGLVMAVFAIDQQTYAAFTSGGRGIDAVLGARGSELQLVLNSVFHLETSPGNIPWAMYQEIKRDPRVAMAIPYAVGDNYKGYRIVGTTMDLFTVYEPAPGEHLQLREGKLFDEKQRHAVIGSQVAERLGLKLGDQFNSFHGLVYAESQMHPDRFEVVGILKPTSGPMDRVIWIPIEAVYRMTGHALRGSGEAYIPEAGKEIPDENKEVSAVLIRFRKPEAGQQLSNLINRQGTEATLAWPVALVMADIFDKMGWISSVLTFVAWLVVAVAAGSILVGIYNSMNERKRDFAILRALGVRRRTIFTAIVMEAAILGGVGSLLGFVVYGVLLAIASAIIRGKTGVVLEVTQLSHFLWIVPLSMTALAALAGVVPAIKAYSTDVATNLTPVS